MTAGYTIITPSAGVLAEQPPYIVSIAFWPRRTTERLRYAVLAWLIIGVIYGFVAYYGGLVNIYDEVKAKAGRTRHQFH